MMRAVVFVVDTSASMGRSGAVGGMTFLDCAKAAVEHFVKIRMRDVNLYRAERHLLVSCGPGMSNVVCGWKDSPARLLQELKMLKAEHTSDLGAAVRTAFDLLNMHRLQSGVDVYGQGRKPWINSSSVVIVLSDGGMLCNQNGPQNTLDLSSLPYLNMVAQQVTPEVFRWDYRLFSVINSFPRSVGAPLEARTEGVSAKELHRLAEVTGGVAFYPTSRKVLLQTMENIAERSSTPGFTLCFECTHQSLPKGLKNLNFQHVRLPVQLNNGQPPVFWWPLPEDYHSLSELPREHHLNRSAHPVFLFSPSDKKLALLPSFPVDKYELEISNFSTFFLRNVKEGMCWPLFSKFNHSLKVHKNGALLTTTSGEGKLVGFLKMSSHRANVVNLFVLPYNFPELFTLLDDLINKLKGAASPPWKVAFDQYMRNLPFYYVTPLRNALKHMGLQNLISEQQESVMPFQLVQTLKKLGTMAKAEADKFEALLEGDRALANSKNKEESSEPQSLMDVPRGKLYDHLRTLKAQFDPVNSDTNGMFRSSFSGDFSRPASPARFDEDNKRFSQPIASMGNFHGKISTLREARDVEQQDLPLFGNPFFPIEKVANRLKKDALVLDESEDLIGGEVKSSPSSSPRRKRPLSPTPPE